MKGGQPISDQPPGTNAPFGWEVITRTETRSWWTPKPDPNAIVLHWKIVPALKPADFQPSGQPSGPEPEQESEITLQLTADQMVQLTISGQDSYGNPVDISGDVVWQTSDAAIVEVRYNKSATPTQATAVAVGPTGTASVTVTNDVNHDGTGDFMGSIAIDVVAGNIAEIEVQAGEPQDKNQAQLPPDQGTEQPPGGFNPPQRPEHPDAGIPRPEPQRGQQGRR